MDLYEKGVADGRAHTITLKALSSLGNEDMAVLADQVEDDLASNTAGMSEDDAEIYREGVRKGAQIGLHEIHRHLDLTHIEDPAVRYSGNLVCYVWYKGGSYGYRTRVERIEGSTLIAELNTRRSEFSTSRGPDEDIYSMVASASLEKLWIGLDDAHTDARRDRDLKRYPVMELCDGDEDRGIWVATTYGERWEM